jgi:hypothetical protein
MIKGDVGDIVFKQTLYGFVLPGNVRPKRGAKKMHACAQPSKRGDYLQTALMCSCCAWIRIMGKKYCYFANHQDSKSLGQLLRTACYSLLTL